MVRSVQVKTLKGDSFRIEVAEDALMADVKTKIAEDRGIDPATQVLICAGKTLKNDDTLKDSVAASGFLVLMVKAARRSAPAAASSTPAEGGAAASTPTTAQKPSAPASTTATGGSSTSPAAGVVNQPPTPAETAAPTAGAGGASSVGTSQATAADAGVGELAVDPASVVQLTSMGFPEDQARAALRAAFNDVSRAASYLMEGIPDEAVGGPTAADGEAESEDGDDEAEAIVAAIEGARGGALAAALAGDGGGGNPLNFMRFHPQFEQLRALVRENPAMLPQVLQQLGDQSPEFVESISAHPDDFLRLMNEEPDAEGQAMMEMGIEGLMDGMEQEDNEEEAAVAAGAGVGTGGQGAAQQGQQVTVELTEQENAAVQNLMAMVPGVGRDQVIEAFIACDKNAEMAANLLFENAFS